MSQYYQSAVEKCLMVVGGFPIAVGLQLATQLTGPTELLFFWPVNRKALVRVAP